MQIIMILRIGILLASKWPFNVLTTNLSQKKQKFPYQQALNVPNQIFKSNSLFKLSFKIVQPQYIYM